jgi:hypothetical protein
MKDALVSAGPYIPSLPNCQGKDEIAAQPVGGAIALPGVRAEVQQSASGAARPDAAVRINSQARQGLVFSSGVGRPVLAIVLDQVIRRAEPQRAIGSSRQRSDAPDTGVVRVLLEVDLLPIAIDQMKYAAIRTSPQGAVRSLRQAGEARSAWKGVGVPPPLLKTGQAAGHGCPNVPGLIYQQGVDLAAIQPILGGVSIPAAAIVAHHAAVGAEPQRAIRRSSHGSDSFADQFGMRLPASAVKEGRVSISGAGPQPPVRGLGQGGDIVGGQPLGSRVLPVGGVRRIPLNNPTFSRAPYLASVIHQKGR